MNHFLRAIGDGVHGYKAFHRSALGLLWLLSGCPTDCDQAADPTVQRHSLRIDDRLTAYFRRTQMCVQASVPRRSSNSYQHAYHAHPTIADDGRPFVIYWLSIQEVVMKIAVFSLILALWATPIRAQVLYASLTGHVADATGADLPRAKVEALNVSTGASKQTVTDDRGTYSFNDLQPGIYRVTISAPSFSPLVQENVALDANIIRRMDVQL